MKIKILSLLVAPLMVTFAAHGMQAVFDDTLIIEGGDDEYMLLIREEPVYAGITHLQWTNGHLKAVQKDDFKLMTHLKKIDLRYNQIKTVDLDAFKHLNELELVDLSGNPLPQPVKDKLQRKLGHKLKLTSPKPNEHAPIETSPEEDLDRDSE